MEKSTINLWQVKKNYASLKMGFVFDSIIEGYTPAEIYVNHLQNPTISIVCEGHGFYFGGQALENAQYLEAVDFFQQQILDEQRKEKLRIAKIYYSSEAWEKILIDMLQEFKPEIYRRILFQHRLENRVHQPDLERDVIIKEIDGELLNSQLGFREPVIDEIIYMWGSLDKFLQSGFGYCAIKEQKIVTWCTQEYKSKNFCGIGIETLKDYQKQGMATVTVKHFLKKCAQLNIIPHWDCWKNNLPSIRVAEKNGFEKLIESKILFIRF